MLTVVIKTYNNPDALRACLASMSYDGEMPHKVIVVDGSEGKDAQDQVDLCLGALHEDIEFEVMHTEVDIDIGQVMKDLIADIDTPYLCIMHDDVVFVQDPDLWHKLTWPLEYEDVGMVGPVTGSADGMQYLGRAGVPNLVLTHYLHGFMHVFRTDLFESLGGYSLDSSPGQCIDMCIRMGQQGYSLVVNRNAFVHHQVASTWHRRFATVPEFQVWLLWRTDATHINMIRKHGLRTYHAYASKALEWDSILFTRGSAGHEVMVEAVSRAPQMWMPKAENRIKEETNA